MKKKIFNPMTMLVVMAFSLFSCAGSGESTNETVMDQETFDEAEVVGDEADQPVNADVSYADLFENVEETENYDILALARMEEDLSIFVQLVELSGLQPSFAVAEEVVGDITVLIPTDEAFKLMPEERYEYLVNPDNKGELIQFVKMHILPSEVPLMEFNSSQVITTQQENEIPVDTDMAGNVVYVGGAQIIKSDIMASNGIIHVVNRVIEPSEFTNVITD